MKIPKWFTDAINTPYESRIVEVEGSSIHYQVWGDLGKPGLVMVHGGGAHAHWWDFIAPFFLDHYRVAALNLSGMGDSEHRSSYTSEIYAKEVMAVAIDAQFEGKPILIGHSLGGKVVMKAGNLFAERLDGVIIADSPCHPPNYVQKWTPTQSPIRPKKVYDTFPEIKKKFRLIPEQSCENKFILDYIAEKSIVEVQDGWSWKFDDQIHNRVEFNNIMKEVPSDACPLIGYIYGEKSKILSPEIVNYLHQILDKKVPFVAIPEAAHHLLLDQPVAFVTGLKIFLSNRHHFKPIYKEL